MKVSDALSILGLGRETNLDLETVKLAYRRACKKYHPDINPAGLEMMKAVNTAWDYLQTILKDSSFINNKEAASDKQASDFGEALNNVLNEIMNLAGLNIEICGAWVWVDGETKTHKDKLKELGFKWAKEKLKWFYRPENYKSSNRGKWDMEAIRSKYGSSTPTRQSYTTIEAA